MIGGVVVRSVLARAAPAVASVAILVAGCGSTGRVRVLPTSAASQMRRDVSRLAASAAAHDPGGASGALAAFAADVARERSAGHLTPAEYTALYTGIARTRARIAAEVKAPLPAPTPVQAIATPAAPAVSSQRVVPVAPVAGKAKGHAKGDGKGNGNGKGGD